MSDVASDVRICGSSEHLDAFRNRHFPNGFDGGLDFEIGLEKNREMYPTCASGASACYASVTDWSYSDVSQADTGFDKQLTLYIDSKYNEPIDWFEGVIALHPELRFDIFFRCYAEMAVGEILASNGEITSCEERQHDDLTEEDRVCWGNLLDD
jgi:hypothetical protein